MIYLPILLLVIGFAALSLTRTQPPSHRPTTMMYGTSRLRLWRRALQPRPWWRRFFLREWDWGGFEK